MHTIETDLIEPYCIIITCIVFFTLLLRDTCADVETC